MMMGLLPLWVGLVLLVRVMQATAMLTCDPGFIGVNTWCYAPVERCAELGLQPEVAPGLGTYTRETLESLGISREVVCRYEI